MQNFNSLFAFLFLALVIGYVMACAYIYVLVYRSIRRQHRTNKPHYRGNLQKIGIIIVTLVTLYILLRWTTQQLLTGCTYPFFWNPNCYDINALSPIWSSIVLVLGGNAVIFTLVSDLRRQDRAKLK